MKLTTKRDLIRSVAKRWKHQYGLHEWQRPFLRRAPDRDKVATSALLDALDLEVATEADVQRITGNGSWTRMTCNQCEKDVQVLVQVGAPEDIESRTANLCPECLTAAFKLLEGAISS